MLIYFNLETFEMNFGRYFRHIMKFTKDCCVIGNRFWFNNQAFFAILRLIVCLILSSYWIFHFDKRHCGLKEASLCPAYPFALRGTLKKYISWSCTLGEVVEEAKQNTFLFSLTFEVHLHKSRQKNRRMLHYFCS